MSAAPAGLEAQAYRDILAALARGATLAHVSALAAGWARKLLTSDGASVTRVDGQDHYEYIAAVGTASGLVGRRLELEGSFTGQVIRTKTAKLFHPQQAPAASRARAKQDQVGSGIVTPILVDDHAVGTLGVTATADDRFDRQDLQSLDSLAGAVGVAFSMVEAHQLRREYVRDVLRAQDKEREAIGSTLQTGTMKALGRIAGRLRGMQTATDDANLVRELRELAELTERTSSELRNVAHGLHSPVLEELGFEQGLHHYVDEWAETTGIAVTCELRGLNAIGPIPTQVAHMVFRLSQEILDYICQHREASRVRLTVERRSREVHVIVEDNGSAAMGPAMGHARQPIRERVNLVDGRVTFTPRGGGGATVRAELPFDTVA